MHAIETYTTSWNWTYTGHRFSWEVLVFPTDNFSSTEMRQQVLFKRSLCRGDASCPYCGLDARLLKPHFTGQRLPDNLMKLLVPDSTLFLNGSTTVYASACRRTNLERLNASWTCNLRMWPPVFKGAEDTGPFSLCVAPASGSQHTRTCAILQISRKPLARVWRVLEFPIALLNSPCRRREMNVSRGREGIATPPPPLLKLALPP